MGLFDAGNAQQTTQPGALSPADIATRLFGIKLLLARLAQTGGAPQTLGEYMKSGPRKFDTSQIAGGGAGLLQALSQPGAFQKGSTKQTYKPSSPSLFQDASGGLVTLALLSNLLKGQGGISGAASGGLSGLLGLLGQGGGGSGLSAANIPSADAGGSFDTSGMSLLDNLGSASSDTSQVPYAAAGDAGSNLLDSILSYGSY